MDIELRKRAGISLAQSRVIGSLALVKNGMTQTEIAEKMEIEAPTLVPIVDKLESLGLVERKLDPVDRRHNIVVLTAKSTALWDSIVDCAQDILHISQSGINPTDLELALSVLRKMNENIQIYIDKKNHSTIGSAKVAKLFRLNQTHIAQPISQAHKNKKQSAKSMRSAT